MVYPFSRGAAHRDQEQTQGLPLRELPNYDALAASTTRATARAKQDSLQDSVAPQTEAGHGAQYEPHFGVPTFLWASASDRGPALSSAAIGSQVGTKTGVVESIARDHLSAYAAQYRLSADEVANAQLVSVHNTGQGPIIVKFKQQLGGIDVFRDEVAIIMNRDLQLIAISGYLAGGDGSVSSFNLASTDAITKALADVTGRPVSSAALASADNNPVGSKYQSYTAAADQTSGIVLGDVIRSKQVMYHLVDGYVPSYYIETNLKVLVTDPSIADLSGIPGTDWVTQAYAYVISAVDGQILFRKNLVQNDSFTYRVWADPVTKIPYDSPAGNDVIPKINSTPDGVQYPFTGLNDITLQNYPFSRNDPWLAPGATETVGNNVDAYVDLFNPDGLNPTAAPADPATGDFRAQITAPGQFLHTQVPDSNPALAEARQAGIQQLFYDVNFLHDWFYEAGFDETSGNAQASNFGRGGVENDRIRAEAQDVSGRNSSNTVTFADGTSPRMQMLMFDPNTIRYVDVLSPDNAAGKRLTGTATFGPQSFDSTNDLFRPNPASGCTAASFTGAAGKFVLVDRDPHSGGGACSIGTKLNNAMTAGATGFILVNLSSQPNDVVFISGSLPSFTIPFLSISFNSAATIKTELAVPNTVSVRLRRDPGFDRDSAIDNQLVFHEWAHYLTGRLIGNGSGMVTNQSQGMAEGWSDFTALLLTARADDALTPSNSTFDGVYPVGAYVGSGGDNDGYYFGIRRYPYSTDMTKNPLTFKHIQAAQALPVGPPRNSNHNLTINASNAEAHNAGEVWASMLWECYASLLRDTQGPTPRLTFQEAQTRMKYYLVAALKMTPINPTFVEGRDALLVAAYATDPSDYDRFWHAFAKRGAGFGAVAPDRYSGDNNGVTESFSVVSDAEFTVATLDDSVTPCDHDGILDTGETGKVTISLRNTGLNTLTATTGTLTTTTPGASFPNGGDVTFASFAPESAATASVNVALAPGLAGAQSLDFQFTYNDPQFGGPHNVSFSFRGNTNLIPASTATDTVEAESPPWTATSVPVTQTVSGVTQVVSAPSPFKRKTVSALQHVWHVDDIGTFCDERLTSPVFTVDGSGSFNVQFDHSWGFEFDGGGNYDGSVVEMSVNGGAFIDIGGPAYNGTILNGGSGDPNPLRGRSGFVKNSAGTVHASLTQAIAPGSTVQIRFREGCDISVGAAGWDIDNIAFTGVIETPFATLVADPGSCPAPAPPPLDLTPHSLPAGNVNSAYPTTSLTASGETGPYTYTVTPFALPPGMVHDLVGGSLQISGTPTVAGTFPLAVVVKDSAGHQQTFNYSIVINKLDPNVLWNNPADITYPESLSATQLNAGASVPGTFTYAPVSGTVLNAGNAQSLSVTFVPADSATYATVVKNVTINVLKGTPVITWNNPADITYGTALGGTQLNATANVPAAFTYTPPATTVLNAGNGQTLSVNFVPTDTANYNNASQNVSINVLKATPTVTWNNPADIVYGTALGATQLNATASVPGVLTYTPPPATVLNAGNGQTLSVNFVPTDSTNYNNASQNVSINVLKATPTVTWNKPADIVYGTALGATQLNAVASVPGVLTYTPPAATVLNAGSGQTLSVNFVPTDTINYNNAAKNVAINVLKATPVITWSNPADIIFGTALGATQLNATASVPGVLTYTPPATTVLNAGNGQTLSVNFVPTDTNNYNNASQNVSINVLKATPTISWNNPADITYGTALSATQLNAVASVPGVLSYTPAATTVLNAGNGQTLSVNFVPADSTNYNNASKNVSINVLKATPAISWNNPADINYGTALGATQLNASANVPGTFFYAPSSGTVLNAGNGQTLSVSFLPVDTANYNNASQNVSINVLKVTPLITWNNPADITYGTPLGATQLNATGSVPGVLTYTPPATTVLNAGNGQTLSVSFVPTDTTNYNNTSKNISINVLKATPNITWSNPADIVYGTALGAAQLNAVASVPGVLTYTPPAATVLNAGNSQTLSASFVPADSTNYNNTSKDVSISVLKATPAITWNNPADITYPTALSTTQLNASANVPGAFTYTPPATTLLNAGNGQTLSVNFVPADTTNYNNASKNVSINVLKATPVIAWNNPGDITYTAALGATQLNATGSVPGAFVYTPPAGAVLNAGSGQTLSVNFVPTDNANYNNAAKDVLINVLKANQTITFAALTDKPLGSSPTGVTGNSTSGLPLSFAIQSGPATISNGTLTINGIGSVTVRASQAGDANYNAATSVDQSFTVTKASTSTAVSSSLNPSTLSQPLTLTATINSVTPTGTVTFKDGAATLGTVTLNSSGVGTLTTSTLTLGLHSISVDYAGDANCLPSSGTLTGGQQVNSPANGVIQFAAAAYSVNEAAGSVAITVTRSGDLSLPASVDYATNDGSSPGVFVPCSLVSGAALDRCDFGRAAGSLQFAAGQSSRTFTVLVLNDSFIEGVETVQLVLSNASAGSLLGSQTTAKLSIIDDDVVISGNLIDNATAFVEQLYHDFLNRQADSAGLAFWTAQITSCGSDQNCVAQARVNVAASFFLSIEFSETGFLVERLHKTAYGSGSGSSNAGSLHSLPVPIIPFNEFLLDRQRVADGVVVGQSGWPSLLENNKVAFINEFVLRSRFTTAYPANMTAATFVDVLNTNAGNPLSSAERNQLVSDLGGGNKSRAQVLRAIAEHPNTVSAEFNRAFVLMQYFGFLRRNPNDAPDSDFTGFDFWLTKLNQFNGNYLDAEMVKAFITSIEYRQRFGN
jgi:hypothetical protein